MSTTRERVLEILQKRYPCAEVPKGAFTDIAAEVGVTRERVRQIARDVGIHGGHGVRPERLRTRYQCICGKEMYIPTLCRSCRYVELPCAECGEPVRRTTSSIANKMGRGSGSGYQGRVFCNRQCFGRWVGKQNKGKIHRDRIAVVH